MDHISNEYIIAYNEYDNCGEECIAITITEYNQLFLVNMKIEREHLKSL